MSDISSALSLVRRGAAEIISEAELLEKLSAGRPLHGPVGHVHAGPTGPCSVRHWRVQLPGTVRTDLARGLLVGMAIAVPIAWWATQGGGSHAPAERTLSIP